MFHLRKYWQKQGVLRLSLPFNIPWNCLPQNVPLRGHRDSAKNDEKLVESGLTNFENLLDFLWDNVAGGIRNHKNHVQNGPWLSHALLLEFRFFCLLLWYFKVTVILSRYGLYVLQHGWYMQNNSMATLFNILLTSRSCGGNIRCFDQNYQPAKIALQVSVLIIKYLVTVLFE